MSRRIFCFVISISCVLLTAPSLLAGDLAKYREFQFGTSLSAVAKQRGMQQTSEVKVVHERPVLIQELQWQPLRSYRSDYATDPVKEIILGFYNGELFQMVVNYDRFKTEGITPEDMIEAISKIYGTATRTTAEITYHSVYTEVSKVIARWEDPEYSYNLVGSSDRPNFTLVLFSKRLDALASAATIEAVRMEKEEAPQREIDARQKQEEDRRLQLDKARLVNKPAFRP